ncbi:Solute carrier organic anion transporter member 5A1, partial [Cichlidogyrus casuarinus]
MHIWFLTVLTVVLFFTGLLQNPLIMLTLRSVPKEHDSFALGLQASIYRIFGYVPGGIVFGKIMDLACEFWNRHSNGAGNCFYSNRETMMYNLT